ncbi:uncharacterized protein BO88DRAFT_352728, partial [Aspergillus vadensis CBS 113365]
FSQAKKAVINNKISKITVLGVSLINIKIIKYNKYQSCDINYIFFTHCFVLAIGRESFRIY